MGSNTINCAKCGQPNWAESKLCQWCGANIKTIPSIGILQKIYKGRLPGETDTDALARIGVIKKC
jgi:hypothetical protein